MQTRGKNIKNEERNKIRQDPLQKNSLVDPPGDPIIVSYNCQNFDADFQHRLECSVRAIEKGKENSTICPGIVDLLHYNCIYVDYWYISAEATFDN